MTKEEFIKYLSTNYKADKLKSICKDFNIDLPPKIQARKLPKLIASKLSYREYNRKERVKQTFIKILKGIFILVIVAFCISFLAGIAVNRYESWKNRIPDKYDDKLVANLNIPKIYVATSKHKPYAKADSINININKFESNHTKPINRNFEKYFTSFLSRVIRINKLPIAINSKTLNDKSVSINGWVDDFDAEIKIDKYLPKAILTEGHLNSFQRNVESLDAWKLYVKTNSLSDLAYLAYSVCGRLLLDETVEKVDFPVYIEDKEYNHPTDVQHVKLTNSIKLLELADKIIIPKEYLKEETTSINNDKTSLLMDLGKAYHRYAINSKLFQIVADKEYQGKKDGVHTLSVNLDDKPIKEARAKSVSYYYKAYSHSDSIALAYNYLMNHEEFLNKLISFKDNRRYQKSKDLFCNRLVTILSRADYDCSYFKDFLYDYRKHKFMTGNEEWKYSKNSEVHYILKNILPKNKICYNNTKFYFEIKKNYPLKFINGEVFFENIYSKKIKSIKIDLFKDYSFINRKILDIEVMQDQKIKLDVPSHVNPREILVHSIMYFDSKTYNNPPILK